MGNFSEAAGAEGKDHDAGYGRSDGADVWRGSKLGKTGLDGLGNCFRRGSKGVNGVPAEGDEFLESVGVGLCAVKNAPVTAEFAFAEGERDEGFFVEFPGGDPEGENGNAEADFHEFFHGFDVAHFEAGFELEFVAAEVFLDEAKGVGTAGVEDDVLLAEFGADGFAFEGPGMLRSDEEDEFIPEEAFEGEAGIGFGLDAESEVDLVLLEHLEGLRGIGREDGELGTWERGGELAEDGGKNVLANRGAGPEAEAFVGPLLHVSESLAGLGHLAEGFLGMMEEILPGGSGENLFAHLGY